MPFETTRAASATLSLEEVVGRLRSAAEVDGVVLAGSAARGPLGPASDVDLIVVLGVPPRWFAPVPGEPFEVVFTHVGGRPADVVVTTAEALRAARHEPLARWVAEGRTLLDRSGAIAAARETALREPPRPWPEGAAHAAWWSACFELVKAERYAASGDRGYRDAAEWIVASAFVETLRAYAPTRELPWRGEREALAHWVGADPAVLDGFLAFVAARSLDERLARLRALAEAVFEPVGGVWEEGTGPRSATWEALIGSRPRG